MDYNYDNEWMEPTPGEDYSESSGRHFKKEPMINVISKEEFEERVEKVFHLLWKTLSKSFGPYGAPTLIYNYPWSHATKDGYTIMKNLSLNAAETKVDQAIADMAGDICGRLNYSVGDGTTSAVIATNSIYKSYRNYKEELESKFILPRDVIALYEKIKLSVIDKLQDKVTQIRSENMDELEKNIRDVVYISSNGDEIITDYISSLYKEIGAPGISCVLAPDGITKKRLITGYKFNLTLNDRLYVNNDNNTMDIREADVVIFATMIGKSTYTNILKPLNKECAARGRNLIVCAPMWDETTLRQTISVDLNNEYKNNHSVNMVLCTYRAISAHLRKVVNDFAVLMNTTVIDRQLEEAIIDQVSQGVMINQIFNIDGRNIEGIRCIGISNERGLFSYSYGIDELPSGCTPLIEEAPLIENYVDLGYTRDCSIGLKDNTTQFRDLVYDKNRYAIVLKDAEDDLNEKVKKYQKMGTFNIEVSQAQERLYALKLKMGIIEVGADSELSQKMLKDSVDDAIKAATSAFNHGVVSGCNLSLIQILYEMIKEETNDISKTLLQILYEGFRSVYKTVLSNAFPTVTFSNSVIVGANTENPLKSKKCFIIYINKYFVDRKVANPFNEEVLEKVLETFYTEFDEKVDLHDIIIDYSIMSNTVFDVSKMSFATDVINSKQTDEEILKATIDLITLLIVGNQMVVTQKHNF